MRAMCWAMNGNQTHACTSRSQQQKPQSALPMLCSWPVGKRPADAVHIRLASTEITWQWGDMDPYVTLAFTGPAAEGAASAAATRTAMKAGRGWGEHFSIRGSMSMGTAAEAEPLPPWLVLVSSHLRFHHTC